MFDPKVKEYLNLESYPTLFKAYKMDNTALFLGVQLEETLAIKERLEIAPLSLYLACSYIQLNDCFWEYRGETP